MTPAELASCGTTAPCETLTWYETGDWRFALGDGALRYLGWRGQEVLRGVSFLARDADWGIHPCRVGQPDIVRDDTGLRITWGTEIGPRDAPALGCRFALTVGISDLSFTAEGTVRAPLRTARTGFVLLHPVVGFSGRPVVVHGPDGTRQAGTVPELVSPGQPFRDIRGLSFDLPGDGTAITVHLDADHPFEMEDQRNWTDASFKTYYLPLALPWPYDLTPGTQLRQAVTLRAEGGTGAVGAAPAGPPKMVPCQAPRAGLVWLDRDPPPGDVAALRGLGAARLTAQIDLSGDDPADRAGAAADLSRALDLPLHLRLVLDDGADPFDALRAVADAAGPVASVHPLPAAFLKSHQPEGPWPDGLSCADAVAAARRAFPAAEVAEGMLTFFPELNRHPPRAQGDSVGFGTAAIVHAADDLSVMETLEALPSVFASARALADGRPVDIGLAALGLWTNPYGAALVSNPDWVRRAMTDQDPRQRGLFGAAWMVGYLAHAAVAGLRSVGVGTVSGPLGLLPCATDDADWCAAFPGARVRPVAHAVRAFTSLAGPIDVSPPGHPGAPAILRAGDRALIANTGADPAGIALPGARITAARVLCADTLRAALADPDWMAGAPAALSGPLTLPPYGVALADLEPS